MKQVTIVETPLLDDAEADAQSAEGRQNWSTFSFLAEMLLILTLLTIAEMAHELSMLNNPSYLGDEGVYMSQAWAVLKEGRLDPYTYTYEHSPIGWLQIALWLLILGNNVHRFGTAIETGRVLMLVYQLGSAFLVYGIARRISRNVIIAMLACLLFSLAPYAIALHRHVLLDNIMTFWVLLSAFLLLSRRFSLNQVWLSATALAIGILSKENAVLVLPVFAFLAIWRSRKEQRLFAAIGLVTLVCSIVSLYVLTAAVRGELFPAGNAHVSLLGSLGWQLMQARDGGPFDLHSSFWSAMKIWLQEEPFLVLGGLAASILASLFVFSRKYRGVGCMGLANIALWLFLVRGGQVLEFYLAPELPFMALSLALLLWACAQGLRTRLQRLAFPTRPRLAGLLVGVMQCAVIVLFLQGLLFDYSSPASGLASNPLALWQPDPMTQVQKDALSWIENHIASCNSMVIDSDMWTELHDPASGQASYNLAHSYWQIEQDPAIRNTLFHNDWHNIDYVIATPAMVSDIDRDQFAMVKNAMQHSTLIVSFSVTNKPEEHINIYQVNKTALNPDVGCGNAIGR
jgi:hypothetical protein